MEHQQTHHNEKKQTNKSKIILLSGTPGTGKTTIAKTLKQNYPELFDFISISPIVIEHKLYEDFDEERESYIVDPEKLNHYLREKIPQIRKEYVIIEGHYADIVSIPNIILAIVLRCHPLYLEERLKKRGYGEKKIIENVQAEILDYCLLDMVEREDLKNKTIEIDTSNKTPKEVSQIIIKLIQQKEERKKYTPGKISWINDPSLPNKYFMN